MPDLGLGELGDLPKGGHAASNVYFGMSPMWVSTVILAVTCVVIMSETDTVWLSLVYLLPLGSISLVS